MKKIFFDLLYEQGQLSLTRLILFSTFSLGIILIISAAIAAYFFKAEWTQFTTIAGTLIGSSIGGKVITGGIGSVYDSDRGKPPTKN